MTKVEQKGFWSLLKSGGRPGGKAPPNPTLARAWECRWEEEFASRWVRREPGGYFPAPLSGYRPQRLRTA